MHARPETFLGRSLALRWGLAGHKGGVLVEGLSGDLSLMDHEEQVQALLTSLDIRVRGAQ